MRAIQAISRPRAENAEPSRRQGRPTMRYPGLSSQFGQGMLGQGAAGMVTVEAPNRRSDDRFRFSPAYTRVVVVPSTQPGSVASRHDELAELGIDPADLDVGLGTPNGGLEGHGYDISMTGMRRRHRGRHRALPARRARPDPHARNRRARVRERRRPGPAPHGGAVHRIPVAARPRAARTTHRRARLLLAGVTAARGTDCPA